MPLPAIPEAALPFFSIIIPTYNREGLVRQTLESVFAQTFTDFEVIIVDDGSADKTLDVVRSFGDRVKIFTQKNKGPGPARNLGARHATGEYLAFLDSDDIWFPWTLRFFADTIKRYGNPALISGNPLRFENESELNTITEATPEVDQYADYYASPYRIVFPGAGAMVVTNEAFHDVNGFVKEWVNGEDSELFIRLGEKRNFLRIRAPWTLGYRTTPGSSVGNLDRTYAGREFMIRMERARFYPGGWSRRLARIDLITSHCRSASVDLLTARKIRKALYIYIWTFPWNFRLRKFPYLFVFPIIAILSKMGFHGLGRMAIRAKARPDPIPTVATNPPAIPSTAT